MGEPAWVGQQAKAVKFGQHVIYVTRDWEKSKKQQLAGNLKKKQNNQHDTSIA